MDKRGSGSNLTPPISKPAFGAEPGRRVACILGIPIDILTLEEVGVRIGSSVRSRQRLFISTVNLNFLALCQSSTAFRSSLCASNICTADGVAVVVLCRFLGVRIPERVAGSDFITSLAKRASSQPHVGVYFFGGMGDAGPRACSAVNSLGSPVLSCSGHLNPGFGNIEELSVSPLLDEINASHADFLVVSLGAEKGQSWIVRNLARLEPPVVSHLGASINFLAGTVRRAPRALQKIGFEWLWRMYQEPFLFKRYAGDAITLAVLLVTVIIPLRLWLSLGAWRHGANGLEIARVGAGSGCVHLKLRGALTISETAKLEGAFGDVMASAASISLDFGEVSWMDPYGAGSLLLMTESAKRRNIAVGAVNASLFLRAGLRLFGLGDLCCGSGIEDRWAMP